MGLNMKRVLIVGGGASGLTAAVFAAQNGDEVTILEHKDRVGKKILMTGNGKCNLTNVSGFDGKYYSSDEESLKKIYGTLARFGAKDTIAFFERIGLYTKEKRDGCVYPVSEQASAVADVLKSECERLKIKLLTNCEVRRVMPGKNGGAVETVQTDAAGESKEPVLSYDRLILATGGSAAPASGSDGSGYRLAGSIGHSIVEPLPALVQLRCEGGFFKAVAGVRAQVDIVLYADGKPAARDRGELQLTDYGISGIPVFQISRVAARALFEKKSCEVRINFLPYADNRESFIARSADAERFGCKTVEGLLAGMVHKKLAAMICKKNHIDAKMRASEAGVKAVQKCIRDLFDFRVRVKGTNPFENAQVCSGGVPLCEVDEHFESRLCKNVYLVGELLDCDGLCGGYNLQWAWATGAIAGKGFT